MARPIARRLYGEQRPRIPASPRILVVELWQIGDVVLSTPLLASLRYCFPDSTITFLGKPHAETLLRASGLVDDVIVAELPWTRTERKYHPADYDWGVVRNLLRRLRERRFDVAFDARMDIRSNILVSLTGAKRRFGFRYGGGDWLLTDAIPVDPAANHKTGDWASLLQAAGCQPTGDPRCILKTTEDERLDARAVLSNHFGVGARPIALHPGGSHAGKRWPLDCFDSLAREVLSAGYQVVAFHEPNGYGKELDGIAGVLGLRVGLREMMAIIEQCATLVCNDSGPMHVAAALGVPTVAIFERGEPRWFGPVGDDHIVIAGEKAGIDVSAAPLDRPPANPVPVSRVKEAVLVQVERSRTSRYSQPLETKL
ncbi:MAG: glycosyltransferase family 9 protein [Gemmatimonadaceae bacterium]